MVGIPAADCPVCKARVIVAGDKFRVLQGNRVWKSGREDSEHSANCLALSSPSSSGFDDLQSRGDETNPNAIPLSSAGVGGDKLPTDLSQSRFVKP